MIRFTPVGHARDLAVTTLRQVIQALAGNDTTRAAAILARVQPESPGNTEPTVAACIGVALGLLDNWLSGTDPRAPADLGARVRLPAEHWRGERAATDILVLARKGRAFSSLDTLIARQGGEHVLYGSALTLIAATQTWSDLTDTPVRDLAATAVRENGLPSTISHRVATMAGIRPPSLAARRCLRRTSRVSPDLAHNHEAATSSWR
jgi:hypothetical protein